MDFSIFDWLQKQLGSGSLNTGASGLLGNGGIPSGPIDPAAEVQAAVQAEPPREQIPMPDMAPTQNVGVHPVQNPAESQTPTSAPDSGITIQRVSSTPVDPTGKKKWDSLSAAGAKLAQAGQPQRPAGSGAAPQVHRGQAVSLLDLVFGPNRKNIV